MKQSNFSAMYDEYHQKILRYVRRMVGALDAEDIVQTVFEKVQLKLADFKGEASIATPGTKRMGNTNG